MSGQWEIVGKSKKKQSNGKGKTQSKSEQKKIMGNGPKIAELLPLSQVQTLYDALNNDSKENKKPGKENHTKESSKKPKKTQVKKKDTLKEKPVLPKNVETAVKMINKKELCSELELGKARFPDAPLVWLKGLVGYLNTRLTVESVHPVFEEKPFDFPQNVLPAELKDVLKKSVLNINAGLSLTLYEWCLTAMANDLCRGDKGSGAVTGYKLVMQLLAYDNPNLMISSVSKVKSLLASYHNRQMIGLSLLWAIGQGGYQDLGVGLHVWHEVMLPLLDLRLYSGYVLTYLRGLLSKHPGKQQLKPEFLLPVLRLLGSPPDSLPTNRRKELQDLLPLLVSRILELPYEKAVIPLFPLILKELQDTSPNHLCRQLEVLLLTALLEDVRISKIWVDVYPGMRPQSRLLLLHLSKSWNIVTKSVRKNLSKMLREFEQANHVLEKQGIGDSHLLACKNLVKELQGRMVTAHARSGFPWMRANFFLLAAIGAVLLYDVRRHGSLRDSSTGRFLHDLGALPYVEEGLNSTQVYAQQSYRWLQKHGPEYYRQACEVSRPYLLKAKEIAIAGSSHIVAGCQTAYTYGQEKTPLVLEWVEQWAPGLKDRSVEVGRTMWEQCKVFSVNGGKAILGFGQDAIMWAQTNVFIGSWSPDNLQLYSIAVLNATQQYALGTYDWLYEKVQTFSKVE